VHALYLELALIVYPDDIFPGNLYWYSNPLLADFLELIFEL
jgi:hypothetical protein